MSGTVTKLGSVTRKPNTMSTVRIVQITDCHLGSKPNESLLGLDTDESLRDVLDRIYANETPDLLLCTGDISNDAGATSYMRFLQIINEYFPQTPLAWLPGNHDDPANMLSVAGHPIEYSHQMGGWNLIFLNSRIPGEEGGRISEPELQRLERELSENSGVPTAIFLHHQPVPVGSAWVDQYVVENAQEMFDICDRHTQLKLISWGHIHQEYNGARNGVALMATPSTCVQFKPRSDEFVVSTAMPGYRTYSLFEDGHFESGVERVEEKQYGIDYASTGY
jgi:Icc protein